MDLLSENLYLDQFKLDENRYLIGIFQGGVSIVKQQTRALNIFNYLVKLNKIQPDSNICVIGGGIAGVTFTSAALKTGHRVTLIESYSNLLHFQKECCTRNLHPNIYEWPDKGSLIPHAHLPILSWEKGVANNVVSEIEKQFNTICKEVNKDDKEQITIKLNTTVKSVTYHRLRDKQCVQCKSIKENSTELFDLVIYAVGYGVEKGENPYTKSYWRNDSYAQTNLSGPSKFLVSGVGDGGLIDVFRLKISEFSYDSFLEIMKSDNIKYIKLIKVLRLIKEKIRNSNVEDDFLFIELCSIRPLMKYIIAELKTKNRFRVNEIILNGELPFESILVLKNISFINAFILFILYDNSIIDYKEGTLSKIENGYKIKDNEEEQIFGSDYEIITRHGTKREEVIDSLVKLGESKARLEELRLSQTQAPTFGLVKPEWQYQELFKILHKVSEKKNITHISDKLVEFFTEKTKNIFNRINIKIRSQDHFVIGIYKIKFIDGIPHAQQVSPYFTNNVERGVEVDGKNIGQVFSIKRGSIGFSIRNNMATHVKRKQLKSFEQIVTDLNLNPGFTSYNESQSYFTLPILTKYKNNFLSSFVIFVESKSVDFFSEDVINTIRDLALDLISDLNGREIVDLNVLEEDEISELPSVNDRSEKDLNITQNPCWNPLYDLNKSIKRKFLTNFNSFETI